VSQERVVVLGVSRSPSSRRVGAVVVVEGGEGGGVEGGGGQGSPVWSGRGADASPVVEEEAEVGVEYGGLGVDLDAPDLDGAAELVEGGRVEG